MSAPETPTGDWLVFGFFEMIAFSCVLKALDVFDAGRPVVAWGGYAAVGLAFFLAGFAWWRLKPNLGERVATFIESVAGYSPVIVVAFAAYITYKFPEPNYRYGALGVASAYVLWNCITYARSLRRDLNRYVMPRRLTARQQKRLHAHLAANQKFSILISANSSNQEAWGYANQLFGAFHQGGWTVQMGNDPPHDHDGIRLSTTGIGQPLQPQIDPRQPIQLAFRAAGIPLNGEVGTGSGVFSVTISVGRRPLIIDDTQSILTRLGRTLVRLGRRRL